DTPPRREGGQELRGGAPPRCPPRPASGNGCVGVLRPETTEGGAVATHATHTFATRIDIPEEARGSLLAFVDMIPERATALGGLALGTARMAASATTLDEYPTDAVAGKETVEVVADRLAAFGVSVREGIDTATELGDMDTAALFTEVSRAIDKHLWFVEAHLQG